jgi:hypothetical protein
MKPLAFLLLLFLFSCRRSDSIPSDILTPEKMESVMWDMMRADQFNLDHVFSKDSTADRKAKSLELYRQVMALHEISQDEFRKSFYYYRARPELLRVVMDSLNRRSIYQLDVITPKPADDTTSTGSQPVPDTSSNRRIEALPLD